QFVYRSELRRRHKSRQNNSNRLAGRCVQTDRLAVWNSAQEQESFEIGLSRVSDNDEEIHPTRQTAKETVQQDQQVPIQEEQPEDPVPEEPEIASEPEELHDIQQGTEVTEGTEGAATTPVAQFQPKPWKHQSSHPIELIMSDIRKGTQTRSQLRNFCAIHAFLSMIEPRNHNEALEDADWIIAMQEELNEF
ncbi:hypothetical protein SOVF_063930, partial [Spinacia oleracea]